MNVDERRALKVELDRQYRWYNMGSRMWSAAHHASLYLAAVLAAGAALILKLDALANYPPRVDIAAIASAATALLATLAAAGGFSRKWHSNRMSRGRLVALQIEFSAADADGAAIRTQLKEIVAAHDKAIVGDS